MTLKQYIEHLERIRNDYGDEIQVKAQTLTHRFSADEPVVRMGISMGKEVPFILINP